MSGIFETPTVFGLAGAVRASRLGTEELAGGDQILDDIEGLSPEELGALRAAGGHGGGRSGTRSAATSRVCLPRSWRPCSPRRWSWKGTRRMADDLKKRLAGLSPEQREGLRRRL